MTEIYQDLKRRILALDAGTQAIPLHLLREDLELAIGILTPDEYGELDELLAEAYCKANSEAAGEQKPRW